MDFVFLSNTILFQGITPEETKGMIQCLGAKQKEYQKGEFIYYAGDVIQSLGIVLSGGVNIEYDDLWGNKSILNHIAPGQVFAETYACIPGEPLRISVVADEVTEVLFLDMDHILQTCSSSCAHHSKVLHNLLLATAQKNLNLSQRILHTSSRSIRGRLVSYLSFQAAKQGSSFIRIPFNRQQLADYLNVDRSALSNELSKMKREGLLEYHKNEFFLPENELGE